MTHLIRTIVQNYIENSNCFSIVAKDGITTDQFAINRSDLLFVEASSMYEKCNYKFLQFLDQ
jgi:hypothetical protein